ncbi:Na+/H+ dicarboxylate symporter [Agrobacterium fabacearum CFBP 5771]|jgi:Na+/H+-dicarboxylate symporter|uniref:dicarboxylate/amino acid:cation symporter n=1 Tax=Rhizobium/Agrobacterium group TaxID=227290 RepID=UPI00046E7340|nr:MULTISPECIES: dicarboxylate/amino acid:cation symporter [Rhizobium/Agrobacterium group]KQY53472.1 sodium:proton antiporter [Rhizobium sp. Root491]MDR5008052.1 dicarboxylate/amino acid:cation symporter [Agrobacterium tumefaciens]NSY57880.1 dicarboxylate/amino acid:cation symporter [Agrobacterium tumefaciens]NTZ59355.1 dicarboxylate/amino acid:cation symporter [Agrobacterium tumefaciens]OMP72968.1 sodium:proton antiporter [Agrobacterium tumefaciens]
MSQATTPAPSSGPKPFYRNFGFQVLIAMVIGLLLGLVARNIGPDAAGSPNWLSVTLQTIGSIFVQLLRALVPPLIFTAIVASIANLKNLSNAAKLVWQTLLWFAITALIAVVIGIVLGLVIQPGVNTAIANTAAAAPSSTGSWLDFLKGLVPANVFGLEASTKVNNGSASTSLNFNVLQLLVVSIAFGVAALKAGKAAEPFLAFNQSLLAIVRKILWWVIRLTPIGTIGLLGRAVDQYGWTTLSQLGWYAAAVYIGLALVLFVVYPALLLAHGLKPSRFFAGAWPAIQLAFVSRSSIGTLPVTETVTEKSLGVPREYAAFAVPLGATTKMDGCAAIYPAISAIFIAQFFQVPLGIQDYVLIVFVSVLGSAATAGLTGAVVMLTLTLSTLGLPLEGVGLLLAIDPILDMGRTAVNVAGQALVPTIVAKREGILDEAVYNNAKDIEALDDHDAVPA